MMLSKLFPFLRFINLALALIIFSILQGCSKSIIGTQLSNSFDSAPEQKTTIPEEENLLKSNIKERKTDSKFIIEKNTKKEKQIISRSRKINLNNRKREEGKKIIFNPQPYRITIKLSAANPSAPAETVTKALRTAGVAFEVEMIELINNQSVIDASRPRRSQR